MFKSKFIIICLVIYFGLPLAAQNKFYIKPLVETKASSTTYFMRESKPINNTGYYFFEKKKLVMPNGLSPLYLGVSIGYHINKKMSIETGIAQDGASSGFNFYFKSGYNSVFIDGIGNSIDGTAGVKVPLFFQYNIISADSCKKNRKLLCLLNLLLGISQYRQLGSIGDYSRLGRDSILVAPDTYMSYTIHGRFYGNKALLYTIGLSSDIKYKKRNICTLTFYYEYGRFMGKYSSILSGQFLKILIEKSGSQLQYRHDVYSSASGFMLQLSRKIHWSDFKKREKEKQTRRFN